MKQAAAGVLVGFALAATAATLVVLRPDAESSSKTGPTFEPGPLLHRLDRLERRLATMEARAETAALSSLALSSEVAELTRRLRELEERSRRTPEASPTALGEAVVEGEAAPSAEAPQQRVAIKAAIEEAVAKSVAEQRRKEKLRRNKEPDLGVVAKVLKLNPTQRATIERQVREHQSRIYEVMEIPDADGRTMLDRMVRAMALQQAGRPEAWQAWSEFKTAYAAPMPGREQTFGEAITGIQDELRGAIRGQLNPDQQAEFDDWKFAPDRVRGIPDSPWQDLERRVEEARRRLQSETR